MVNTLNKIEVVTDYKHLQIREITDSGRYSRRILTCDMTLAEDEHQEIKDKAKAEWTDEVKEKWTEKLEADKAEQKTSQPKPKEQE